MAESFVFYRSFRDAIGYLDAATQLEIFHAVADYALDGIMPENISPVSMAIFTTIRPQIDANTQRREIGSTGGRKKIKPTVSESDTNSKPTVSQNDETSKPTVSSSTENKKPTVSESGANQKPNVNVNDNVNENENENVNDTAKRERGERYPHTRTPKPGRNHFGMYGHVMLTTADLDKLCAEHGADETMEAIQAVDKYCEQTGRTYNNYALTIEKWGYQSVQEEKEKKARSGTPRTAPPEEQHDILLDIINGKA